MQNYADFKNQIDYTKIKQISEIIKKGGIVVFLNTYTKWKNCKKTCTICKCTNSNTKC